MTKRLMVAAVLLACVAVWLAWGSAPRPLTPTADAAVGAIQTEPTCPKDTVVCNQMSSYESRCTTTWTCPSPEDCQMLTGCCRIVDGYCDDAQRLHHYVYKRQCDNWCREYTHTPCPVGQMCD